MTIATHALAEALDRRIRAVVEPLLRDAIEQLQKEIAAAFGAAGRAPVKLAAAPARRGRPGRRPKAAAAAADGQRCNVVGCRSAYRSKGYCAAHYQAARKYGWPMPAPESYVAPPRPRRGRPPKSAVVAKTAEASGGNKRAGKGAREAAK